MSFEIREDRLHRDGRPVAYEPATSCSSSRIVPEIIILHDTAGQLDKGSSVDWFRDSECKASAHLVIERDGSVTQMVDLDRKAFHAGESSWQGKKFCNGFAIGIEIVNPGELVRKGDKACAYFHKKKGEGYPIEGLVERETKEHGHYWWMPYTPAQIEAVTGICKALAQTYPTITDIVTHWIVSPGRKVDTNPLFPLEQVREDALVRRPKLVKAGLSLGARGNDVRQVQERLMELGYGLGAVDGMFGPRMRAAVLAFEAENGLDTDGVLSAKELSALFADDAKPMPLAPREGKTIADLKRDGSETVKSGARIETVGKGVFGLATTDATLQATAGFSPVGVFVGYVEQAILVVGKVGALGVKVPAKAALYMLAAAAGATLWKLGRDIQWRRLADYVKGLHLGR